jgi:hypothetical protein
MRADALLIHPFAQRERSNAHVKRLMENLDLDAIGTISAVQYPINGKSGPWVVDGQHRILALIESGCGEWDVPVQIYLDVKNDKRASELFLRLNARLLVDQNSRFVNEVKAGDYVAVGANDIVRKYGLTVAKTSSDGSVACPAALKKAFKYDDGQALNRALGWLTTAYGKRASAVDGKLIEGAALVAKTNNGNLDDAAMVKKLSKYPGGASAIVGDAKGRLQFQRGSLARSVGSIIIDTYNLGRRAGKLDPL